MAQRGSGVAVGYIRGKRWQGKWTPDLKLQRRRIAEFADKHEYEVIQYGGDEQRFSLQKRTGYRKLHELLELCAKHKGTFLYVDIGNWRPNTILNDYIRHYKKSGKTSGWKMLAVPPDRKTIEAIERQARLEKFETVRRPRKKSTEKKDKILTPLDQWQLEHNIGKRRMKGFEHLYKGVEPIYRFIQLRAEESPRLTNKRIAWALDREAYLTVDGKRWTDETVRKARELIQEDEFLEFVRLKEADKEFKFDTE